MSYCLNSLKGGYIEVYMGDYCTIAHMVVFPKMMGSFLEVPNDKDYSLLVPCWSSLCWSAEVGAASALFLDFVCHLARGLRQDFVKRLRFGVYDWGS